MAEIWTIGEIVLCGFAAAGCIFVVVLFFMGVEHSAGVLYAKSATAVRLRYRKRVNSMTTANPTDDQLQGETLEITR